MRRAPQQSPNPNRSQKVEDKPILNTEKETVRLLREANHAQGLKKGSIPSKKPARDSTGKLAHPVAEMDKSLRQEGHETILRRIRPNTVVGPFLDVIKQEVNSQRKEPSYAEHHSIELRHAEPQTKVWTVVSKSDCVSRRVDVSLSNRSWNLFIEENFTKMVRGLGHSTQNNVLF